MRLVLDPYGKQLDLDAFIPVPGRYIGDFNLNANQLLGNQAIQLQGHEMYFAVFKLLAVATNAFRVKLFSTISGSVLTLPNGNVAGSSDRARSDLLYGTASRPGILPAFWLIPGTGQILHDFEEIAGAGNTIHVEYEGLRLFPR